MRQAGPAHWIDLKIGAYMNPFFSWERAARKKTFWFSITVILTFALVALFAPWLAPHDPYEEGIARANLPPMWVHDAPEPGLTDFPLGTDRYGRDILSRMIYGTRTAFFLIITAIPLAALLGTIFGLIAGYAGGRWDEIFLFISEMIQSLPGFMFLVIIILIFRTRLSPSWFHGSITLVIGFTAVAWVSLARLVRIQVIQIKSQLFVEAAVSLGATTRRILTLHILPNVLHIVLVWIINTVPAIILLEAVLGYIGIGVTTVHGENNFSIVSWGGLFFSGRSALSSNPLILIIPSLGVLLISMSFIMLADIINSINRPE